jgi:hypothetical protein
VDTLQKASISFPPVSSRVGCGPNMCLCVGQAGRIGVGELCGRIIERKVGAVKRFACHANDTFIRE